MKKLALLFACIILFSVSLMTMNGCTKQKAQEEPATEQMEEAAPDTTQAMEMEEAE